MRSISCEIVMHEYVYMIVYACALRYVCVVHKYVDVFEYLI